MRCYIHPCKLDRIRTLLDGGEDYETVAERFGMTVDNLHHTLRYHGRHGTKPAPRKREKPVGERIKERAKNTARPRRKP